MIQFQGIGGGARRGLAGWLGAILLAAPVFAERPSAPRLLPESTLFFARVANVPALQQAFSQTATGRMARDPQLQPLLSRLWQSAVTAFAQVEENVGTPLNDLLALPQGELCVALVAPLEGPPQLVAWIDCGDQIGTMQKLLERGEQEWTERGGTRTSETIGDTELLIFERSGRRRGPQRIVHFVRDNTAVFSTDAALAKQLLVVWTGQSAEDAKFLADNRKFTAIMSRCAGAHGEEPQVTWFIDPFEIIRVAGRGQANASFTLAILQGLGVDGLQAIGGSMLFAAEDFDNIIHAHVLLENPRKGVIDALALQSGEVTPEPWIPADAATYMSWNWDVPKTYHEIVRLYEQFRGGPGVWQTQVLDRITERTGLNLEQELIEATAGRFTWVTWMEKPARINGQATILAIKMKDPAASQRTVERLADKWADRLEKKAYGGITYYQVRSPENNPPNANPELTRGNDQCVAILDDYLILSDSSQFLQQAIITKSDATRSLAQELDFKIVASRIKRQLGENRAGMISFNRPEEAFRQVYEVATSDSLRGALKTQIGNNPVFRSVEEALVSNPLPPFAVLAQYLAPGGSLLTSDETGFHFMAFALRRQ